MSASIHLEPTGVGKSSIIAQLARSLNLWLRDITLSAAGSGGPVEPPYVPKVDPVGDPEFLPADDGGSLC
ncbi:MAG: hypothetical protein DMG70_15275 [Acidobacteria bacterium]|nr:MAG: hypothetical protein DMG70_15275 [Acidobacteriota bacterium]PYY07896.1 MAG: hypothetical protein DMG69_17325 [Acidobacteriota bacterium]